LRQAKTTGDQRSDWTNGFTPESALFHFAVEKMVAKHGIDKTKELFGVKIADLGTNS
jgi:hypothetical protein